MAGGTSTSRPSLPAWVRAMAAVGIVAALSMTLGAEPFRRGLDSISLGAACAALTITAGTTWCCARRWSLLAGRLGVGISITDAYRAYYRAQFLNATLPSGVVGEVDRAVWHGHASRAMSRGIRSVLWDRVSGQLVLFGWVVLAIPVMPQPVRSWMVWSLIAVAVVLLVARTARSTFTQVVWAEARDVPGARGVWSQVVLLSTLALAGHVTVFLIAARAVGVDASTPDLITLALVVLQVSAIPLGVAGWGPREGGAALVFGAVGLDAGTGLAVSVTYGVLAALATLPGVWTLRRRKAPAPHPEGGTSWAIVPTQS